MIKLIQILSEIKIEGRITPEMVTDLWIEILNKTININYTNNIEKLNKLLKNYPNIRSKFELFSQQQLNSFYRDLLNFKNNDLSEIKITGNKWFKLYTSLFPKNEEEEGEYILSEKAREILLKYYPDEEENIDNYLESEDFDNANLIKDTSEEGYDWKQNPEKAYKGMVIALVRDFDFYNGEYHGNYDNLKILEIKIEGRITPKIVYELFDNLRFKSSNMLNPEFDKLYDNYGYNFNSTTTTWNWIYSMDKVKLKQFYKDLQKFKK